MDWNPTHNDIFGAAILSVPVCGEDVEVTDRFSSLGSDIHVSAGKETKQSGNIRQAHLITHESNNNLQAFHN